MSERKCVCGDYRIDHHSLRSIPLRVMGIKGACRVRNCSCEAFKEIKVNPV